MSARATIAELIAFLLVWALILIFLPGCGSQPTELNTAREGSTANRSTTHPSTSVSRSAHPPTAGSTPQPSREAFTPSSTASGNSERARGDSANGNSTDGESNGDESSDEISREEPPAWRPRRAIDEAAIAARGIRSLTGKHRTLYTDLPLDAEIKSLPEVFDQAFEQWREYFQVAPGNAAEWQMRAVLIGDKSRFAGSGLLPEGLPPFRNGYAREGELWLYEQPSAYYRRHLLLHEGTHGFMEMLLGGAGPPWHMEGLAELLATHTWQDGALKLNVMPTNKEDFEMLGRIKIVQEGTERAGRPKTIDEILNYGSRAHLENEPYGWCWALTAFLDGHPAYRARFRRLQQHLSDPRFNHHFTEMFHDDAAALQAEWRLFAATIEHGHDLAATAIEFRPGAPLPANATREVVVEAARGWQPTGIHLEAGKRYRLLASGRYKIGGTAGEPWICEPGGVTIHYYRGEPLGKLLAAVVEFDAAGKSPSASAAAALLSPMAIGLAGEITPDRSGTLVLQLNDSAGQRGDNTGAARVAVSAE